MDNPRFEQEPTLEDLALIYGQPERKYELVQALHEAAEVHVDEGVPLGTAREEVAVALEASRPIELTTSPSPQPPVDAQIEELEHKEVKKITPKIRRARIEDIDDLADIDLLLFDRAYGETPPPKEEVVEMLTKRFMNNPKGMFVAELDGKIEGFVSAFPTSTPLEKFTSWEESTGNGTLDGKVDPKGKYVYVTNMTIKHEAVVQGAEDMLIAQLFANAIEGGAQYGYFVSRIPHFKRWMEANDISPESKEQLQKVAEDYSALRGEDGKRHDPQLRMYEGYGFKLVRTVADAFEDDASLDFGVVCKAVVPPVNKNIKRIKPIRQIMASGLRLAAKSPKVIKKVVEVL